MKSEWKRQGTESTFHHIFFYYFIPDEKMRVYDSNNIF